MGIILFMTGGAVHWRADEERIDMAALAGHGGVFAIELECKFRMIDSPVPTFCHMT